MSHGNVGAGRIITSTMSCAVPAAIACCSMVRVVHSVDQVHRARRGSR